MRDIDDPAKVYQFLNDPSHQDNVSVIIVNYNCRTTLARCLSSIVFSSGVSEILLADNGSTDDSMNLIEGFDDPRLTIIRFKRNLGLALARNLSASRAKGRYLAFVDADTEVHREWLTDPISTLETHHEIGAVQCINMSQKNPNIITHAGMGTDGLTWRELPKEAASFLGLRRKILYPIGAGFVIRRDAWDAVNGFDPTFFVGHDDVDLGVRLWQAGFEVICSTNAIVYHDGGILRPQRGVKQLFQFYNIKNLLIMWTKNLSPKTLTRHVVPMTGPFIFLAIFLGRAMGIVAIISFLKDLPKIMVERGRVQQTRKCSDDEIMRLLQNILPSRVIFNVIFGTLHYKYISGGT